MTGNPEYRNMLSQVEHSAVDLKAARAAFGVRFNSGLTSDARLGTQTGRTSRFGLEQEFPSGQRWSAGVHTSTFGDSYLSEARVGYSRPIFPNLTQKERLRDAERRPQRAARLAKIGAEELALAVFGSYVRLLQSQAYLDVARGNLDLQEELARAAEVEFRLGRISRQEVLGARLSVQQAERQDVEAEFAVKRDTEGLLTLMGDDPRRDLRIPDGLSGLQPPDLSLVSLQDLENQAVDNRLELIDMREEQDEAWRDIDIAKRSIRPPINVDVSYAVVGQGQEFSESLELDQHRVGFGLSLNSDFTLAIKRGELSRSRLAWQDARRSYQRLERSVINEVRQHYRRMTSLAKRLDTAQARLELAEERLRLAEFQASKDLAGPREVLVRRHEAAEARHAVLTARLESVMTRLRLQKATGSLYSAWIEKTPDAGA